MFTQAEYHALTSELSNDARVLYCLGLRPTVCTTTGNTEPLNYKFMLALLNGDNKEKPYSRGRQINSLLRLLEQAGLLVLSETLNFDQSLNGQTLLLPLCVVEEDAYETLHRHHQPMSRSWQPHSALFDEMASLIGIIDTQYSDDELGEFIAYWMGRPTTVLSAFQWTQKFTYSIKKRRLATGMKPVKQVGTQQVSSTAGIEADENARKLVEKYSTTQKKP